MSDQTGRLGIQERSTRTTLLSRNIPCIRRWPDWEALRALKDEVHPQEVGGHARTRQLVLLLLRLLVFYTRVRTVSVCIYYIIKKKGSGTWLGPFLKNILLTIILTVKSSIVDLFAFAYLVKVMKTKVKTRLHADESTSDRTLFHPR